MTDARSLHEAAVRAKPKNQTEKASTYWVAILKACNKSSGEYNETDFLWIKCHCNIKIQTIRSQYEKCCLPDEPWELKLDGKDVDSAATVGDLNTYHDQIVVFETVKISDLNRPIKRQPLQPKYSQVRSPPQNKQVELRTIEHAKPPDFSPQSQPSNAQDENRGYWQGSGPQPVYLSGCQQIPAGSPNTNAYTLSPTTSHRASPAPYMMAQPSTQSYGLDPLARSRRDPSTPASFSSQSPDNPLVAVEGQDGFTRYWQIWADRFRIAYPHYSSEQLQASIIHSWNNMGPQEKASYLTQSTPSPCQSVVKPEPKAEATKYDATAVECPPIIAVELDDQNQKTFQLQVLLKDASPEMLESSVEQGVKLLDRLKAPLVERLQNSPDAEQWIQQIENLRKLAAKTKTVIGVVGNTGAGKSSVINAMLEEERLVPTNCMRACTAVVTEISYNYEAESYRAQIEFISPAEWERELKVLFQDLLDGNGQVSRECSNEDTDAGIAYAKIKAVYPRKTKEDIANSNIETMLREVSHVLGTSKDIKESDSLLFYKKLQHFVDSKEKSTGLNEKDKDKRKGRKELEFWPLIRVVRLYVKSPALSTGAVIVDLPGVHDANAARAAVAEGYMKKCTGLWIVTPINRAVDDKAAKSLLGESFKRQLKMDGGFNSITFICSKTDDISLEEAQESLGLDDDMGPEWAEIDALSRKEKTMKKELEDLKDTKTIYGETMNDVDEQMEIWDALKDKLDEGESVYAPKPKETKKRKNESKEKAGKKKRRTVSSDDEDSDIEDKLFEEDDSERDRGSSSEKHMEQAPLSEDQIVARLQELKATKKEARGHKLEITEKITSLRKQIEEAEEAEQKIKSKLSAMCISGRNQYSKGAIQQDFAAGIKELDQELAAEEDEENFNPDIEKRDYEEVARGLPVFCVSSRGYQKLKGRLRKDPDISGFTTVEETEIPQLQAHCEKLTETGRSAKCRSFNNKLSQLLNSLTLWVSSDGTGANMTVEQKAKEAKYLQKGLATLESGLEKAVKTACKELNEEFADNIFDLYEAAVQNASNDAVSTALQWGAPVNREDRAAGGLYWATYKAICRRDGIYANAQGPHDWNIALAEPMLKVIASGWEKVFTRRLPLVMANFAQNAALALRTFHSEVEARALKIGTGIASLAMLQQQVGVYESLLKDLSTTAKDTVNTHQREINREFTPVIERAMQPAYEQCAAERGLGSYARMKAAMSSHIAQERHTMFQQSADNVRSRLNNMVKELGVMMDDKADEVFHQVKRDYRAALGGGDVQKDGEILPKTQRIVRKEIIHILEGVEKIYMRVAGIKVADEDAKMEDAAEDNRENEGPGRDSDNADGKRENLPKEEDHPIKDEGNRSYVLGKEESLPDHESDISRQSSEDLEGNVCAGVKEDFDSGSSYDGAGTGTDPASDSDSE